MATIEMVMPKMGESIIEGTILTWLKKEGESIEQDESVLEVATDKVDTEVPATFAGVLKKILVQEGEVVSVGAPIAIIEAEEILMEDIPVPPKKENQETFADVAPVLTDSIINTPVVEENDVEDDRFYSPLVKSIAKEEGINKKELSGIVGTGKDGRVTKADMIQYLENRPTLLEEQDAAVLPASKTTVGLGPNDEIIQMDRMRIMIAERMIESKKISAHVTSFVEADVTNVVLWRNKIKDQYKAKTGESITFTPFFVEAIAKAIKDFPMINVVVDGNKIIKKKDINIGIAVALQSGNLIVPVIKKADQLNLIGLSKKINELAGKARDNKLSADELSGGTYTLSNIGSFGNLMGTPIIMQPQVAILAVGSITKKPAVLETPTGDVIAIRHKMFLSHSYDHRVIDGSLGGMFVKRVADYLGNFDIHTDF